MIQVEGEILSVNLVVLSKKFLIHNNKKYYEYTVTPHIL